MILSRRLFLAGCASLPALSSVKAAPLLRTGPATIAGVGEVFGLPYWARATIPAVTARRRAPEVPAAWHPEFS